MHFTLTVLRVLSRHLLIAPRTLATSGRRPGVRAKRAACGVAGHQVWTGRREKTCNVRTDITVVPGKAVTRWGLVKPLLSGGW